MLKSILILFCGLFSGVVALFQQPRVFAHIEGMFILLQSKKLMHDYTTKGIWFSFTDSNNKKITAYFLIAKYY